ncbi:MAG: GNAT family N-acetyltransferase [Desulfovibrio sp.]|uniref:GNAT family N-acetyltransferase n=1 Tax=Desulfovibrio sp. 7SRBS1 TaxID=3378064 RepID=UPI003B3CC380
MTTDIIIKHPTTADVQACSLVEQACFPPEEAASLQSIQTRIASFSQGFLVAESDGRIIGQVNSGATNKDDITDEAFKQLVGHDPAGKNMVIFSLSVLPEYQKSGVASRLLREFLDLARAQEREAVLLLCKSNLVRFYERFGFVSRGLSACTHGGAQWLEMCCPVGG